MRFLQVVAVLFCALAGSTAGAQDMAPQLMLDPAGHMARINGLAFTPDGRHLVSAGDDKVVRVWDWQTGNTVRTIRGEVGPGNEGKIYVMALSPDGHWLAVGGWMHNECGSRCGEIRLYDFATGKLVALLKGHRDVVHSLAFSPDSARLISGSGRGDRTAIIWDLASRKLLHHLKGHRSGVESVAFNGDGSRVATSSHLTLRLWSSDGQLLSILRGHVNHIAGIAFSPADGTLASTSWDNTVKFWDGKTEGPLRSIDVKCGWGLAYTRNGRSVICSKGYVIDANTGHAEQKHYASTGQVVAVTPDSRLAATVDDNHGIRIWDTETDRDVNTLGGTGRDVWALGFSDDGCDLAWGNTRKKNGKENDDGDLELEIRLPCSGKPLGAPRPLSRPATAYSKPVTNHDGNDLILTGPDPGNMNLLHVRRGSTTMLTLDAKTRGYRHQVYTFSPDGKSVLSGGANGNLTVYNIPRGEPQPFIGHVGYVYALAVSPNGQLVASGATDKTINIWNLKTRELIVTLFRGSDGEWVMWTPQGYYTSSPNGDRIVGWQINKGADQAADYVTANQLRDHFYRPDIVERAIVLASATAALAEGRGTDFSLADLLRRRPPIFEIISPQDNSRTRTSPIQVQLKFESNADPVQDIEVLVNGRQATTSQIRSATARLAAMPASERSVDVPLEQGENQIRIVARNKVGQTVREFILFRDLVAPSGKSGTLYVLSIGVDKYDQLPPTCGPAGNQSCDLRFAGRDARAFRDVLVKKAGPLHNDVKTMLLARDGDRPPTKANIEDGLEEMLGKAGHADTTVLFIAGHGVSEGRSGDYLFLPEGTERAGQSLRRSTVIPWSTFQVALQKTLGRRLMFADTCHSGGAYNARLVNDATNANIVVFSATDVETLSWEFAELQHGAFTYALIQGLEGKAGRKDGTVTILGLGEYVSEDVTTRTKDKQQPTFNISGAKNFILAKQ